MSLKYPLATICTICLIFLLYVRSIQRLNYGGKDSLKQTNKQTKKQTYILFAVYESDTPVTLQQGQGHQTWYDLVDQKQGYHNAKFENLAQTVSMKKQTIYIFCCYCHLSPLNMCERHAHTHTHTKTVVFT